MSSEGSSHACDGHGGEGRRELQHRSVSRRAVPSITEQDGETPRAESHACPAVSEGRTARHDMGGARVGLSAHTQ
jgi:hypothetical protein